ncbi:hypothetical protein [Streptomyces misionensis]|uniref:hypothetical protein n=1 Tax=Streptomyces misionensis TaxID=67331 RepID=UPI0033BB3513
MPARTAAAATVGLASGLLLAVADPSFTTGDVPGSLLLVALLFIPVTLVTLVAMGVQRRWLAAEESRRKRDLEYLSEQRRLLVSEFNHRREQLDEREARLKRLAESDQDSYRRMVARLDAAYTEIAELRHANKQLEEENAELCADFTDLVMGTMQERSDAFKRPRTPRGRPALPDRRRAREEGTVPRIPRSPRLQRQPRDEPQHHSRPAEG